LIHFIKRKYGTSLHPPNADASLQLGSESKR